MRRITENTLTARNFENREAGSVIVLANLRRDVVVCAKAKVKASPLAKRAPQLPADSVGADSVQDDARRMASSCIWQRFSCHIWQLLGRLGSLNHLGSGLAGGMHALRHATCTATETMTRTTTRFRFERGPAYQPRQYRISAMPARG